MNTPSGWFYVAVNVDRDGDMEFFLDGVSQGTVDISGDAAIAVNNIGLWHPADSRNAAYAANSNWSVMALSEYAAHTRLLTPQEIQAAYYGRTVNNIQGSTLFNYQFIENIYPTGNSSVEGGLTTLPAQFYHIDCVPGFVGAGPTTSVEWANMIYNNTIAQGARLPDRDLLACGVNTIILDASGNGEHCYYGTCATSPGYNRFGISDPGDFYNPTLFFHDPDR